MKTVWENGLYQVCERDWDGRQTYGISRFGVVDEGMVDWSLTDSLDQAIDDAKSMTMDFIAEGDRA